MGCNISLDSPCLFLGKMGGPRSTNSMNLPITMYIKLIMTMNCMHCTYISLSHSVVRERSKELQSLYYYVLKPIQYFF